MLVIKSINKSSAIQHVIYNALKYTGCISLINFSFNERSYLKNRITKIYWYIIILLEKIRFKKGYYVNKLTSANVRIIKNSEGIFIGEVENSYICGGSSIIIVKDTAFINQMAEIENEVLGEENNGYEFSDDRKIIFKAPQKRFHIPKGVIFTDPLSYNYAHWITEVLPRINYYCENSSKLENAPLLINSELGNSINESIDLVSGNKEIILVDIGAELLVDNLIVVSPTGYVPFSYRNWNGKRNNGTFNKYAMLALRNSVLNKLKITEEAKNKIYIKRNSHYRMLINHNEVEDFYRSKNYKIIEPEKLSFKEQVILFNSADQIAGVTGAGMANIIFTKPGCKIDIIISDSKHHAYNYWDNIARCSGNNVGYLVGSSDNKDYIHSDFWINIDTIEKKR
jgi:capsular polysaccharide biosynthesis protein